MIIAGLGCRKGTELRMVLDAIDVALAQYGLTRADLSLLASVPAKASEPALAQAAQFLGLQLIIPEQADLLAADQRSLTRSEASLAATGLNSACEAAALSACGPVSELLGPRSIHQGVTCALAKDISS